MEMERSKLKAAPHISSAHLRSLVKQLSSSRSRANAPAIAGDHSPAEASTTRKPKKQVRRRSNTSRPYQDKLLNMAEARREIATALKFHRAAMKRATEQQQKEKLYQSPLSLSQKVESFYSSPVSHSSSSWTYPQFTPLPISDKLFNFSLPNQTLGLNLNFQSFDNVETTLTCNIKNNNNKQPISSSSTSTSTSSSSSSTADPTLHRVMGDEEMEEIRLISEKHDIEWNDIMNSVTMAWWSKFSKAMEDDVGDDYREGDAFQMLSEMMEIPAWLSDGSEMNNYLFENQDFTLPCLEIGEIGELEADWFGLMIDEL